MRYMHLFVLAMIVLSPLSTAQVCGDCNGDTNVNILDALIAAQHAASAVTLLDPQFGACNVEGTPGDSMTPGAVVNVLDALILARYTASLVPTLNCQGASSGCAWQQGWGFVPPWSSVPPTRTLVHPYDWMMTAEANGALLADAILALQPGDELRVTNGTYSIDRWFNIVLQGTAAAPIRVVAENGQTPILTRPDAMQNVINVGSGAGNHTEYFQLRGFEITGGDTLVKLYSCSNVWIDNCHIHHGEGVGIAANSADTDHLYITSNHIHDPGTPTDTSEGMYLGANNSVHVMSCSVIAANWVHDCGGTQGDGIEVKQGSYDNLIAGNLVHDTNYPGIIAYGTDGNGPNVIERNTVLRSNDNALQVQGEAIVRNNLVIGASGAAFQSHDHQGMTRDLTVIHNTFVNTGRATNLSSWDGRAGMVFANNVVYSQSAESIRFPGGSTGVTVVGNVVFGSVTGVTGGTVAGTGLSDFVDLSWDGMQADAMPTATSPIRGQGDPAFAVPDDLSSQPRSGALDSGAVDAD